MMPDNKPSISVVIPTYNRAEFLREAVDSVRSQSYADFEIIIVDDGSADSTTNIVSSMKDSRIVYLKQKHGGVSAARNLGISRSRAPFISFLDSDDLWLPRKLETQMDFFRTHPEASICQTEELWMRRGRRVNPAKKHRKHSGWIFKECLPLCIVSPSAVMMRREIFDDVGGFDEDLPACEDYDLWLRTSLRYPIYTLPEALTVKRGGHPDQLSKGWGLDRYRIVALKKILSDSMLTDELRGLVRAEIDRRSRIVIAGARKRGNADVLRDLDIVP